MKKNGLSAMLGMAALAALAGKVPAAPTQEEVFRSINQNVSSNNEWGMLLPFLVGGAGVLILLMLYGHYQNTKGRRKTLNHTGRLLREVTKCLQIKSIEMKQLKVLAEENSVENPVTLLLCPSLLNKVLSSPNPRVDRKAIAALGRKLMENG